MVDPQATRFWRAAVQSGLVEPAALQACWDALPEEKRTADAADRRLARQAINFGCVTIWQAQQLLTGRVTGFKIDRYVLRDLVGQGGMGRVYLATDTRLSRRVALKVLSKERMNNPRAIARFLREAKVGAQLQHENLVRIYDEGESSGIRYLVMEYIDGKNVGQLIGEQGAIPWAAAARLARQVALGLDHARLKGLIHRDVNPCNILVTHDGTAKLTDLGLAIDLADDANVTRDGATVGTFDYISPEQAKHSRSVDTRADIYSLGCTIYHMIAGRVPFPVPSLPEKLYAHQLHDADPLNSVVSDVPEGLARVVQMMMRKRPEDRYPTPVAVAHALEPFVDESARIDPTAPPTIDPAAVASIASAPRTRIAAAVRLDETAAGAVGTAPHPVSAAMASDPDLAILSVDVGPEVPLSASLSSSSRAKPRPKPPGVGGREWGRFSRPSPPMVAAGLIGLAMVGGVVALLVSGRDKTKTDPPAVSTASRAGRTVSEGARPGQGKVEPSRPPAIAVVSSDGSRTAGTLAEAVAIAVGNGGEVVLNPSGTLRLSTAAEVRIPRGNLVIRAAEGVTPVVAIDVSGPRPLLIVTPGASLTIKGVTVIAHYQAQEHPPALIQCGGGLTLDRCSFLATGATGNSRAVLVEGLKLAVDGCLFEGFDRTIDVDSFPGSEVAVRRSMIVRAGGSDQALGWAIRLQFAATRGPLVKGAPRPRRVVIEHATIKGSGLCELVGFSAADPLTVELDHAAIQTRTLLAWAPRKGESQADWSKGLKWTGKSNRFDVTGDPWIVLSAAGELPMPNAPNDLKTWTAAVNSDKDSTGESFRFAANPAVSALDAATIEPAQFALVGDGLQGIGADPKRVGPGGKKSN